MVWATVNGRGGRGAAAGGGTAAGAPPGRTRQDGQKGDLGSSHEVKQKKGSGDISHRITESQNSRGWKGPLWVI